MKGSVDSCPPSLFSRTSVRPIPSVVHAFHGRVVRNGPNVGELVSEVRDLTKIAADLSRELAELAQEISALKRRRTRRAFPFPAAAPSPVPGSDLDLFPKRSPGILNTYTGPARRVADRCRHFLSVAPATAR